MGLGSLPSLGGDKVTRRLTDCTIADCTVVGYGTRLRLADETQGVQVKLCYPLTMCAIPERLR